MRRDDADRSKVRTAIDVGVAPDAALARRVADWMVVFFPAIVIRGAATQTGLRVAHGGESFVGAVVVGVAAVEAGASDRVAVVRGSWTVRVCVAGTTRMVPAHGMSQAAVARCFALRTDPLFDDTNWVRRRTVRVFRAARYARATDALGTARDTRAVGLRAALSAITFGFDTERLRGVSAVGVRAALNASNPPVRSAERLRGVFAIVVAPTKIAKPLRDARWKGPGLAVRIGPALPASPGDTSDIAVLPGTVAILLACAAGPVARTVVRIALVPPAARDCDGAPVALG